MYVVEERVEGRWFFVYGPTSKKNARAWTENQRGTYRLVMSNQATHLHPKNKR